MIQDELRIYIVMRKDIGLQASKPKFGVQIAHAALAVFVACLQNDPERAWAYYNDGQQPKIVLQVKDAKALLDLHAKAKAAGFHAEPIVDAGRTEFPEPTLTCLGLMLWHPAEAKPLLKRVRLYTDDVYPKAGRPYPRASVKRALQGAGLEVLDDNV